MNTQGIERFEFVDTELLATTEGGTGVLEVIAISAGLAWTVYSFGEAAGKTYYYKTHP